VGDGTGAGALGMSKGYTIYKIYKINGGCHPIVVVLMVVVVVTGSWWW